MDTIAKIIEVKLAITYLLFLTLFFSVFFKKEKKNRTGVVSIKKICMHRLADGLEDLYTMAYPFCNGNWM